MQEYNGSLLEDEKIILTTEICSDTDRETKKNIWTIATITISVK